MEQLIEFSKNLCTMMQQQQSQFEQQSKATQKQIELLNVPHHQQLKPQLNLQEQVLKQQDILKSISEKQLKQTEGSRIFSAEGISNSLTDFYYKPMDRETFPAYYHHYHVVPRARISLTLSRHFSLSFIASGRSLGLHPVSSHSCCMYVRADRSAFAWPYVGVHRSTSLMSSSLLLQQCPASLVRLTWIFL